MSWILFYFFKLSINSALKNSLDTTRSPYQDNHDQIPGQVLNKKNDKGLNKKNWRIEIKKDTIALLIVQISLWNWQKKDWTFL
jgi:hypothetical protein